MTALYCRLSKEDGLDGESNSISVQTDMLTKYAVDNGLVPYTLWKDDGYTGTSLDRPAFKEMLGEIEKGKIQNLVVKDTSRIGRNYLAVGLFLETLTKHNVRLISLSDGVDTDNGEDDFMPFRTILHEFYAKDISRKIKSSMKTRALKGEYLTGMIAFGYKIENKQWVIDTPAADTVKEIFRLYLAGYSFRGIAKELNAQGRPTRRDHRQNNGAVKKWDGAVIAELIDNPNYTGTLVTMRYRTTSFKDKTVIVNPPDMWVVTPNHHEPIIPQDMFDTAQQIREQGRRKLKPRHTEIPPLKGYLFCADCGRKLYYSYGKERVKKAYYYCYNGKTGRGSCDCSLHYLREEEITQVILRDLRDVLRFAETDKKRFAEYCRQNCTDKDTNAKTEKTSLEKRIQEIDGIIRQLYEDRVSGVLPTDRFMQMLGDYTAEQDTAKNRLTALSAKAVTHYKADKFIGIVDKYTDIQELTPEIVSAFIRRVLVGEKIDGERKITIEYNFIGELK